VKILNIFNHYLDKGGEAAAVDAICDSLAGILDLERMDLFSSDWTGAGAPPVIGQALRMIRNPETLRRLRAVEARAKSDFWLTHNVFPVGSLAIYREAERLQIPVIQYLHNFRPFSVNGYLWAGNALAPGGLRRNYWAEIRQGAWQDSRLKTAWLALVLTLGHRRDWWRNVKAWIAVSDFMRERFVEAGIPPDSIFTLRHFWRLTPESSSGESDYYLFLGRLAEPKGVRVLLATWELLESRLGSGVPRLIIAGDGPLRSEVAGRCERLSSVTYAGEITGESKEDLVARARAVIAPSLWWEALGLVVYEAYDKLRPVLAARSGGLAEIVVDQETGLLHEPGNVEQLAEQVVTLENDPEYRRRLGRRGREWLAANASEAEWQRRFLKIVTYARGA
jgi:glycosyltransferase involved in cell wall biosynthesis